MAWKARIGLEDRVAATYDWYRRQVGRLPDSTADAAEDRDLDSVRNQRG